MFILKEKYEELRTEYDKIQIERRKLHEEVSILESEKQSIEIDFSEKLSEIDKVKNYLKDFDAERQVGGRKFEFWDVFATSRLV